jgi:PAS domain S-box-containing protein
LNKEAIILDNRKRVGIESFEDLFENISSMYVAVDILGNIYFINSYGAKQLGYIPSELSNTSLLAVTFGEDKIKLKEQLYRVMDHPARVVQWKDRKVSKSGDVLWFLNEVSRIDGDDGAFILFNSINITESKRVEGIVKEDTIHTCTEHSTEKKLHETKELLGSFIESSPDAIVVFDLEGYVLRINPSFEKMFGWTSQEAIGTKLSVTPEFLIPEREKHIKEMISGKVITDIETVKQRRDGSLVDVSATLSPIRNEKGKVIAFTGIARDITELKRSRELFQNTEKLSIAGQLAAGIAHEIRNPLTSLKGFLQLMELGGEQKREYYKIMKDELNRIELILSELLILVKPDVVNFQQKDMRSIFEQVVTLLDTQAIMNNVQILTIFDEEKLLIDCDENQIKQVFINFIKNGIEAMPKGGELVTEVKKEEDTVMIRIQDQGCGIPEEQLAKIGQPFYTTKENGTGLGLMVTYNIIENHQGSVSVESKVNKGTTFTIVLPTLQSKYKGNKVEG